MSKIISIISVIYMALFFTACANKQMPIKVQYVYKEKYVYLPCPKFNIIDTKSKKNIKNPIATTPLKSKLKVKGKKTIKVKTKVKYKEPKPKKFYAPKQYRTREHKQMDFMLGINQDGSEFIYLEGEFGANTYKNFLTFMKKTDTTAKEIKINSNGGLVSTAMQLGSYVYENKWSTGVDKEMHCFSACGFVYFAGRSKSLQGKALIGLHRPYVADVKDTNKSIRKTKRNYLSYWNYIHASKSVYDEMMEINRDNLFILDRHNINDYVDVQIN